MKNQKIIFWTLKVLVTLFFLNASVMELIGNEDTKAVYQLLGFPLYLMPFIAVCRMLALLVIWLPGFVRLKEWAFAGLAIDVVGAGYCLVMATGDINMIWVPLIALLFLLGFYYYYHNAGRKKEM